MLIMNNYLATVPFDVYELQLFHLVATSKNFTKAGQEAGLTQSAITRQIQGMENSLGIALFERTTRRVSLTAAGQFLFARSKGILKEVASSIHHLQESFRLIPQTIRVGVSRSIGLAYLPGFFVAFQKKFPSVQTQIVHQPSSQILNALDSQELDVGVICPPPHLPRNLQVTHSFEDNFIVIAPPGFKLAHSKPVIKAELLGKLFQGQQWLLINKDCNTGKLLDHWLARQGVKLERAMEMDNFDLIVNLVGMGIGASIVPHRALPLYPNRRAITRIRLKPHFTRKLVVVTRKNRSQPQITTDFVKNILF